jgi:ribose/xylose/arabinose/galactoside ABC-type transport system permease subunit
MHMEGKTGAPRRKVKIYHSLLKSGLLMVFVLIAVILTVLTKGVFLRPSNIINVLVQSTVIGIMAIGMTMVIIDRGIDLSVGGIAVFASSIGAIFMAKFGMPWGIAVPVILMIGLIVGFLNGASIAYLGMAPFISTLAMMKITQGFAQFLLGGQTVFGLPEAYRVFGQGDMLFIPVSVWILVLLGGAGVVLLKYSFFGRELYAMGGNPLAAWLSGLAVKRNRIVIYMISGLMSAAAGIIITSRIMCAQITIGQGSELDAIAAAVIGGVSMSGGEGGIIGAITGAVIIVMINNGLNLLAVSPFLQTAVKGLVIFGAITLDIVRTGKEKRTV